MIRVDNLQFSYTKNKSQENEELSVAAIIGNLSVIPVYSERGCLIQRKMQEIIPGLFLGPYSSAARSCLDDLMKLGITHIICVRHDIEAHFIRPRFTSVFKYLTLNIADAVNENIICHFSKARQFIEECLNMGGKVLVHGNNGISRSATLVLSYIMQKYGLSFRDAYNLVKERRFCIMPNEGFVAQLFEYEPIFRAEQMLKHGQCSNSNLVKKRKSEELESSLDMVPLPPPPSPVPSDTEMDVCNHIMPM